ncbi:MAG: hypothetical protein GXY86_05440 [Firmicutes bacterium]|nr:hypothetical protein [Bacillota bacterium]
MRHKMRFIGLVSLLMIVLILPSIGWGLSSETIMNRQPLHFENQRVDLDNPLFQGNFGYRYPIETPTGINGLEPVIALVYNSEINRETYLGVGWSMIGYNQIRRNDRQGTPWYDGRDSFILTLNGKEYLFDANGHPDQGTLRIEGSAAGEWRVYEGDGTELLFSPVVGKAQGTYLWVLTRMRDTNGNTVTYTYDNSVAATEGVSYLTSVKYQDNLKILREVRFEYEFYNHSENESLDPTLSYWPGLKQCYRKRLQSITSDSFSYTLEYRISNSNGRCLLSAVRPSDGEPVIFNYDSDSLDSGNRWEFTAKWGLSFLADYVTGQFPRIKDYAVLIRDFNNDGLPDIYVQKHNREWVASFLNLDIDFLPQIYLNDGNGGWELAYDFIDSRSSFGEHYYHYNESPDTHISASFSNFEINQLIDPRFFDLNGDGYQDIVLTVYYYSGALYHTTSYLGMDIPVGTIVRWVEKEHLIFWNDGQGEFSFKGKTEEDFQGDTKTPDYLDLDGDGMVDPTPFRTNIMPIPMDANGDRFPDLFSQGRYHVNQGDGTFQEEAVREQELFFRQMNLNVDLNGDGVADQISFDRVNGQLTCANDTRYNLNLLPDCRYNNALNYVNALEMFADVDNNGFKDIITLSGVYLNKTKTDLLTRVSGAEQIEVSYTRIAVPSQYGDDPQKKGSAIYRWAVEKITADDDICSFSYQGGLYDLLRREFRGYSQVTVTGNDGATVYTYNPADRNFFGLVQSVTGPEGSVQYDYTFSGGVLTHLTTTSNPKNAPSSKVENDYDNDGNLTRQVQELNDNYLSGTITRTYEYSKSGKIVNTLKRSYEEGSGVLAKENLYYYDDLNHGAVTKGNLTQIDTIVRPTESGSKNLTVKLNYDGQGIATGVTDAFGNTTITELLIVNEQYKKRVTRNALGHESYELIETATGLTVESVDPNGAKTTYVYYPDRRLKRVTRPDGAGPYQDTGRPVLVTRTYNSRGQVVTESLPYFEGDTPVLVLYQYEEMEDGSGGQHRLVQATRPDGAATSYEYDDPGRQVTVIDPKGNRIDTVESYQTVGIEGYGNLVCRVVTVTDAMRGRTVSYYDLEGNLVQQTDANGRNKLYYYDSLGRVYKSKDPYKGEVKYAYDENGRLFRRTDAKGQILTYQYDALNRITAKVYPDNRKTEWLYDLTTGQNAIHTYGIGRLGAYKDKSGTTRLGYDISGNLIRKEQAGYGLSFGYDLLNRTTGIGYPNDYQIRYTYDLGSSKLQTDDNGKVLSTDVTKPFGPRICSEAIKDDFTTLDSVNVKKSKIVHDAVTGVIQAPAKGVNQKKFLANNQTVTEYSAAYNIVKAAQFRLTEQDTKQRKAVIRITLTGKARIRVTGEDGIEYLSKEYSNKADNTYSVTADLTTAPNQIYTVTLELAGTTGSVFQSINIIFEVSWGNLASNMGVLYSLQKQLQEDARSVKLSWVGNGILFDVSTDNGKTWETVENGKITRLKNPGRKIVVKALLPIDSNTFLDNYILEINPAGYSLFTGKVLDESTGLVYFGARWYDPEVGRFISPDPEEDGENWYAYCGNDPVNYIDPDGRLSLRGWGVLWGGLKLGFKVFAPKKAMEIATAVAVGSAITIGMSALMPVLPGAIPIITAVMPYVSAAMMVPFAMDIVDDLRYLIKNFSPVFLNKNPSDAKVRTYGVRVSKVALNLVAMFATQAGMKAIMKTGILQKLGGNIADKLFGKKITVIGRFMQSRIEPTAKNLGGECYNNPPPDRGWAKNLGANRKWIRGVMDKGRTIVDIGQPPGVESSDYYNLELSELLARGYRVIKINVESLTYRWLIRW